MKNLESLKLKLAMLVELQPMCSVFPPQPWDAADLDECVHIVEDFVRNSHLVEVVNDNCGLSDWLDSWHLHHATTSTKPEPG